MVKMEVIEQSDTSGTVLVWERTKFAVDGAEKAGPNVNPFKDWGGRRHTR